MNDVEYLKERVSELEKEISTLKDNFYSAYDSDVFTKTLEHNQELTLKIKQLETTLIAQNYGINNVYAEFKKIADPAFLDKWSDNLNNYRHDIENSKDIIAELRKFSRESKHALKCVNAIEKLANALEGFENE